MVDSCNLPFILGTSFTGLLTRSADTTGKQEYLKLVGESRYYLETVR